jgi:hypothetical protein
MPSSDVVLTHRRTHDIRRMDGRDYCWGGADTACVSNWKRGRRMAETPMTNLVACPFCGDNTAEVRKSDNGMRYVECGLCKARGPFVRDEPEGSEIEKWNNRPAHEPTCNCFAPRVCPVHGQRYVWPESGEASFAHKPGCAILTAAGNPACSCGALKSSAPHSVQHDYSQSKFWAFKDDCQCGQCRYARKLLQTPQGGGS